MREGNLLVNINLVKMLEIEQARLASILDNLPVGIWIADKDGKLIGKNDMADRIWMGNTPLLKGIDDYAEYTAWYADSCKRLMPEDYPIAQALITGQYVPPVELTIQRFDDSFGTVLVSAAPVIDKDGENCGAVGINVDITERKKTEEALKKSERLYRTLFENTDDAFQIIEPLYDKSGVIQDFKFVEVNSKYEKHTGFKGKYLVGKTARQVYPDIEPHWLDLYEKADKTSKPISYKNYCKSTKRWYDTFCFPYSQNQIGVLLRDITEQKKFEAEIVRLDRLNIVGEMAAALGHEIRNPLTTVRGYLQMMQRKKEFSDYIEQFSTMIEELDRANSIISEFLSLAKNKAIDLVNYNLNVMIKALHPLLQAEALRTGHELIIQTEDIPDLRIDEKEIRQLLLNFTRNAFEAMLPGGTLTIATRAENSNVILTVSDTGPGIPDNVLENLGTPFITTKENGVGLGLAVCNRIVDRHNARLLIDTSPNGTAFTVIFQLK